MYEQPPTNNLLTTALGTAVLVVVMAGLIISYAPPVAAPSITSPIVVSLTPQPTARNLATTIPSSVTASPQPLLTPTQRPTYIQPTVTTTPTPEPTAAVFDPEDHYWLERPIAPGGVNYISRFYPYGSTYRGRYQVHHGVEFENPMGTPILAAGPGKVVVAGSDDLDVYGPFPDFYGRLVVIQHDRTFHGQPLITLYGHLSQVRVAVGQRVETGQIIGEVGQSGVALGPHLHMEVRIGRNTYDATRNPELWIRPFKGFGTLAGRLLDADGNYISGAVITLYTEHNEWYSETETYGQGVNPDEGWQENFVFGDVPAGRYRVQYADDGQVYDATVTVEAGKTAFVILQPLQVDPPMPHPLTSPKALKIKELPKE